MKERDIQLADLLQLPTAITVGSFALVCDGSRKIDTTAGKLEIAAGRLGDIADGLVARKLDMSSDAGAVADAVCDKLGMAAIGTAMWQREIAPRPLLAAMAARNLVNAGATLYNGIRDTEKRAIRPPKSGKYAMAADNLSLGAFLLADELQQGSTAYKCARGLGYAAAAVGLVCGIDATRRYLRGDFDTEE